MSDAAVHEERTRDDKGRFQTGNSGGGRPRGSRNKLGQELIDAFYRDFNKHGPAVVATVRRENPGLYLTLASRLVPQDVHLTVDADAFVVRAPMVTANSQAWQAATGMAQIDLEASAVSDAIVVPDAPAGSAGPVRGTLVLLPKQD